MPRLTPVVVCLLVLFGCGGSSDICTPNDCGTSCTNVATQRLTMKFGGVECSYLTSENVKAMACAQQLFNYCHGTPDGGGGGVGGGSAGGGAGGGSGGGSGGGTAGGSGGSGGGTAGGVGGGSGGSGGSGGGGTGGGAAVVTVIANGVPSTFGIAVSGNHIFWTAGGNVMQALLDGGSLLAIATNQNYARGLAADSSDVYWANASTPGTVMKVAIGGGTPVTVASGENSPLAVVLNGTNVIWTAVGGVKKAGKFGGAVTTLAPGPAQGLAVDETYAYWSNPGSASPGTLSRVPLVGGTPELLVAADAGVNPFRLAVDPDNLYWVDQTTVSRLPLDGGAAQVIAQSAGSGEVVVDATRVYWANFTTGDGGVLSAPRGGTGATPIARTPFTAGPLAQDATRLYWITGTSLVSTPK